MLTLADALRWQPSALDTLAASLRSIVLSLDDAGLIMQSARSGVEAAWTDASSDVALARMRQWVQDVDDYSPRFTVAARELVSCASAIEGFQRDLRNVINTARAAGYAVTGLGLVIAPHSSMSAVPGKMGNEFPEYTPGALNQALSYEQRIQHLVGSIAVSDATAAGVVQDLGSVSVEVWQTGRSSLSTLPVVPTGMSSAEAADWWKGLSSGQRSVLTQFALPALYGVPGLPARVEDEVNRYRLEQELALTETMSAEAAKAGDPSASYWDEAHNTCVVTKGYLDGWAQRLPGSLAAKLPAGTPLLLIGFSSLANGGKGSTVLSMGDPDTATHISGFVEGVGSRPTNLPFANAEAILREELMDFNDIGNDAMVIYQLGPMPSSVPGAIDQVDADTYGPPTAKAINAVIDSREAAGPGKVVFTVFSHSFGTEVLTHAAETGTLHRVTSDVLLASPGVNADSGMDYGIDPNHVYQATADGDPISYFDNWGAQLVTSPIDWIVDPGSDGLTDPSSFAHNFPVDPGGHSSYFQSHRDLVELARIAEGLQP